MQSRIYELNNSLTLNELSSKYCIKNIDQNILGLEFSSDSNLEFSSKFLYKFKTNYLFIGKILDLQNFSSLIKSDFNQRLGNNLEKTITNYLRYSNKSFNIKDKLISFNNKLIMGILNVTPDSFSDGGKFSNIENAVNHAKEMINDGADIIDIGGESTRPGSELISVDEELKRVIPVIEKLHQQFPEQLISIDTNKAKVAEEALNAGASIVNDISGGTFDDQMFKIVSDLNAVLIIMHIKGKPKDMQINPNYNNLINDIYFWLAERVTEAEKYNISKLVLDPGIGFGKSVSDNYEIISRLSDFKSLGYPLLIGLSKKSYIGKSFNIDVDNREVPTIISETIAMQNGANIIRTHNVKNAVYAKKLLKYYENPDLLKNV